MSWTGLFEYIEDESAPPECSWKPGGNYQTFSESYVKAEMPFRQEIENVVNKLANGESVRVSPGASYFLGIRGEVIQMFLFSLDASKAGIHATIIPFPALDRVKVMRWLLIDWWNSNGPEMAALLKLKEMHTSMDEQG